MSPITPTKKLPRWLRNTLIGGLLASVLAALGITYAVEHVLPYSPIRPLRLKSAELMIRHGRIPNPTDLGMRFDSLSVWVQGNTLNNTSSSASNNTNPDTIELRGWFVFARTDTVRGTVLLLHGISDCRASMLPMADVLTKRGFNVVTYDSRANGESGGVDCTFGYYEKHDVSRVIDEVVQKYPDCGPIAIYGNSLGAAVSVQAMALDKRIICGVVESPFATLREVIRAYFQRMFFVPVDAIPDEALDKAELIAHFDADAVAPEQSATLIGQPVMVVHGLQDKHIDASCGKRVFDNLKSNKKVWYPVAEGTHYNLLEIGGQQYLDSVAGFFVQNIN